ncbi:MFS transporter [Actinophytocola sp.]|uniref:MFS transporter n=1 Tax=Actinophytocola sp. TaxID=1872138 RepID=UPI002ED0CB91
MTQSEREVSLWRLSPLVAGAFAIGVDASVLSGILLEVSEGLHAEPGAVGQVLAVFPLTYAIAAPLVATLVSGQSQRRISMAGLLLFALGNLVAASGTITLLGVGRFVAALGACAYLPNATATAAASAPERRSGRAVSLVLSGVTAATVLGVPAGIYLAALVGWRWVLISIAVLGLVSALAQQATGGLANPRPTPVPVRDRLRLLGDRTLLGALALTVVVVTGEFVVHSYLAVVVDENVGAGTGVLALALTVFGASTLVGTISGGVLSDRFHWRPLLLVTVTAVGAILVALPLADGLVATLVLLSLWGMVGWTIVPTQLHRLFAVHPTEGSVVASLNSSSVFLGVALGGLVGSWAVDGHGIVVLCLVAAAVVWCALFFLLPVRSGAVRTA